MEKFNGILLSTAYLGPIEYFAYLVDSDKIYIEKEEHYIKQTYRNRCKIYTANGIQALTIPVIKVNGNHTKIKDVQISNAEKWQMLHWRAITAAYSHSPYFLYYKDEFEPYFFNQFKYLWDFNNQLLNTVLEILDIIAEIIYTDSYSDKVENGILNFRNEFSPKKESSIKFTPYTQVFAEKFGFIPNLSILDLIFDQGPESLQYLKQIKLS